MQPFERFTIEGWAIKDESTLVFSYNFDDKIRFNETLTFPNVKFSDDYAEAIGVYCDYLAIALGISYYKLYPVGHIRIAHCGLDAEQKHFRHEFYIQGLGEFFFRNSINPQGLAHFTTWGELPDNDASVLENRSLLLWGGGKDSIVSYEMVKSNEANITLFTFGKDYPIHQATAAITGEDRIIVQRSIDISQLEKYHALGYYNGHVPITGIISFVSALVCKIYGFDTIITSNEQSANFGNTHRQGITINHQWSKSEQFEQAFQSYLHEYINPNITYYSQLRQYMERQIAQHFAEHKKYFTSFSSCNRNFHLDGRDPGSRWCCVCPKCLFVYIILRPFLTEEETMSIWGKELYSDDSLLSLAKEIWGFEGIKPFECVGTYEESRDMTMLFIEKNPELAITYPLINSFIEQSKQGLQ